LRPNSFEGRFLGPYRDIFAAREGANDEIVTVTLERRNPQTYLTLENSLSERRGRNGTAFAI